MSRARTQRAQSTNSSSLHADIDRDRRVISAGGHTTESVVRATALMPAGALASTPSVTWDRP